MLVFSKYVFLVFSGFALLERLRNWSRVKLVTIWNRFERRAVHHKKNRPDRGSQKTGTEYPFTRWKWIKIVSQWLAI